MVNAQTTHTIFRMSHLIAQFCASTNFMQTKIQIKTLFAKQTMCDSTDKYIYAKFDLLISVDN